METKIDEIAAGIYRLSTFVAEIAPPAGFTFNQFLVLADEPLLFHTGLRRMFPLVRDGARPHHATRAAALDRLRPLRGGRVRRDERVAGRSAAGRGGARADRLPRLAQRHGRPARRGCSATARSSISAAGSASATSIPRTSPTAGTRACSTRKRRGPCSAATCSPTSATVPALTESDVVGPAIAAEDMFRASSLHPGMGATIRRLAAFSPRTLAVMHGSSFVGDGAAALCSLADDCDRRVRAALEDADVAPRDPAQTGSASLPS